MLPTPHYKQSRDGFCLPACARMVLAHWGQLASEGQLATLLGTKSYGTPISNISRLQNWGYNVHIQQLSPESLQDYINRNIPVIVQLWPMMLSYWEAEPTGSHVVVVVGYDEQYAYLHDPATAKAAQPLLWDGFLAAWAEFDETAVIIIP